MPLKGIPRLITPQLLDVLARMGHGDQLLIADANFPSHGQGVSEVIHCDGSSATDVLKAVLELFPLDSFEQYQAAVMKQVDSDEDAPIIAEFQKLLDLAYTEDGSTTPAKLERVERFAFYERAKSAFAICVTGESRLYGNIILKKGVIDDMGRTVLAQSNASDGAASKRVKTVSDYVPEESHHQKDSVMGGMRPRLRGMPIEQHAEPGVRRSSRPRASPRIFIPEPEPRRRRSSAGQNELIANVSVPTITIPRSPPVHLDLNTTLPLDALPSAGPITDTVPDSTSERTTSKFDQERNPNGAPTRKSSRRASGVALDAQEPLQPLNTTESVEANKPNAPMRAGALLGRLDNNEVIGAVPAPSNKTPRYTRRSSRSSDGIAADAATSVAPSASLQPNIGPTEGGTESAKLKVVVEDISRVPAVADKSAVAVQNKDDAIAVQGVLSVVEAGFFQRPRRAAAVKATQIVHKLITEVPHTAADKQGIKESSAESVKEATPGSSQDTASVKESADRPDGGELPPRGAQDTSTKPKRKIAKDEIAERKKTITTIPEEEQASRRPQQRQRAPSVESVEETLNQSSRSRVRKGNSSASRRLVREDADEDAQDSDDAETATVIVRRTRKRSPSVTSENDDEEEEEEDDNEDPSITLFSIGAFRHFSHARRRQLEDEKQKKGRRSLNSLSAQQQLDLAMQRSLTDYSNSPESAK